MYVGLTREIHSDISIFATAHLLKQKTSWGRAKSHRHRWSSIMQPLARHPPCPKRRQAHSPSAVVLRYDACAAHGRVLLLQQEKHAEEGVEVGRSSLTSTNHD